MMYKFFLYVALLLSHSFFSLQSMTLVLERDDIRTTKPTTSLVDSPEFQKYLKQRKAAEEQAKKEEAAEEQAKNQPQVLVLERIDTKADVKVKVKEIVEAKTIAIVLEPEYTINEDGETPGAFFDRLDEENERNRVLYSSGLLILAGHQALSEKYKAQITEVTQQNNWVAQLHKLEELTFRTTSIEQTQGIVLETLTRLDRKYKPKSIFVPDYPHQTKNAGSSIALPLKTVEIRDCDPKIIDQLSTKHRSFWSWLITRRKPVTVFFVPEQTEKQKAEGRPMYVQCSDALSTQFDTKGELGIAGASFQSCHEIEPPQKADDKPGQIPTMHYMSAADGTIQLVITGLGAAGAVMPVVIPVAAVAATGYVCWEIFESTQAGKDFIAAWKDRSEKKAARKAEEAKAKAERKAQEERLKAEKKAQLEQNKNGGGGGPKKPDDDKNKKGLNKKQQAELDKQKRYPAQNEPVGDKGVYEDAGYHHPNSQGAKSKSPKNGQKALNNSVEVEDSSGRVGVSDGEFVVLKETSPGKYHGHVRNWEELTGDMQEALKKYKLASPKGKIL